jgi:OOP family OmpA-OmpF porin
MARHCSQCGNVLAETDAFCAKCGAPTASTEESPALTSTGSGDSPRQTPVSAGRTRSGATVPKIAIVAIGFVGLLIVTVVAGVWYVVHRARQKAAQIEAAYTLAQKEQQRGIPGTMSRANASTSLNSESTSGQAAPQGYATANGQPVPTAASSSAAPVKPVPMVAQAATGNQEHDWALEYERTVGGPEADLVVRTGDINNLGFGWQYYDFAAQKTELLDPFSGKSTQPHQWPDIHNIPPNAPPGTDRIMIGSAVIPGLGDGYSGAIADCALVQKYKNNPQTSAELAAKCKEERALTAPTPIVLLVGDLPPKINAVVVQMFVDDFQPVPMHSHFQVSLNGTRIPNFEYAINSLDQSGPIGKLLTLKLLPEYWPLLKTGKVNLLIDDPTTHVPDGYAIDFVRILVNPHAFKYQVSLTAKVTDADTHTPIPGATVTTALDSKVTDRAGKCHFAGLPAGLVTATANAPGYDENSTQVDLPVGHTGEADIQLYRHKETIAALEQSIAQSGTVSIYGIHFDTGSSKLRPDSMPALQAVLGLIKGRPGSNWIIAGHTDNQGSDALNVPLSQSRAASVVSWLIAHGVASGRLEPHGFGSTRPVADNATAAGRFLNRRVEVALAK